MTEPIAFKPYGGPPDRCFLCRRPTAEGVLAEGTTDRHEGSLLFCGPCVTGLTRVAIAIAKTQPPEAA